MLKLQQQSQQQPCRPKDGRDSKVPIDASSHPFFQGLSLAQRAKIEQTTGGQVQLGAKQELEDLLQRIVDRKAGLNDVLTLLPVTGSSPKEENNEQRKGKRSKRNKAAGEQKFLREPRSIFASPESLAEVYDLIAGFNIPMVHFFQKNALSLFGKHAARTFLQAWLMAAYDQGKSQRIGLKAIGLVQRYIIEPWAYADAANMAEFYERLLSGAVLGERPTSYKLTELYALANFFWREHAPCDDGDEVGPSRGLVLLYDASASWLNTKVRDLLKRLRLVMIQSGFNIYKEAGPKKTVYMGAIVSNWRGTVGHDEFMEWLVKEDEASLSQEDSLLHEHVLLHQADLAKKAKKLWDEIAQKKLRDVRSSGNDFYFLKGFVGSEGCGIRYFLREGFDSPSVGVVTCDEAIVPGKLAWFVSVLSPDSVEHFAGNGSSFTINHFADLLAYHQIVCGERHKDEDGKTKTTANKEPAVAVMNDPKAIEWHCRRLPEGSRGPSQTQIDMYKEKMKDPEAEIPSGYTYVQDHTRRVRLLSQREVHAMTGSKNYTPSVVVDIFNEITTNL